MKNKKGFTLIELLAVIVILAIIALIATPIILNMIENAKKGAAKDSAYGYIEAIDFQNSMSGIDSEKYKMVGPGEDLDVTTLDVKVKGSKPESGTVTIDSTGRVTSASIVINGYEVTYNGQTATVDGEETNPPSEEPEETVTGPTSEDPDTTKTKGLLKIVYLDPTDLTKQCDATNSVSTTGTKTGCMKWYAYKDDGTNYTMILDHNTTPFVAWNSSGFSSRGMKEVVEALKTDTEKWSSELTLSEKLDGFDYTGYKARLITANELAEITGAKETLSWTSDKTYADPPVIGTSVSWFYLDGADGTDTTWQTQVAKSKSASKYGWAFDNTYGCTSYGCNISDDNKYEYGTEGSSSELYGYWTSTPVVGGYDFAWSVFRLGCLSFNDVDFGNGIGVRPVITISKSIIS